jgi:hypothetical protein
MGAATRRFQALLNAASEIVANELDKETEKHYSSSVQYRQGTITIGDRAT